MTSSSSIASFSELPKRIFNKVALVTGGGGSIGRAIVLLFAREGAKVSFVDTDESFGLETLELVKLQYQSNNKRNEEQNSLENIVSYQKMDVSNEDQVKRWIQSVADKWGRIDILVNNAAAFVFGTVEEATSYEWDRVLSVNVKGYAFCIKHVAPIMRRQQEGSIVNMASISSFIAQPGFVPYNTSKGAILQLTRCTAMDLGVDNIRVNCVCPGTIDTPATDKHAQKLGITKDQLTKKVVEGHFLKRLGTTEDVAYAVLFLASNESKFITGTPIIVDGGFTAN